MATEDDLDDLAHLMLEAYRGTIDYDGEGIEEAVAEVRGYFAGSPIADCSVLLLVDGRVASACLVGDYDNGAIVGYVMTTPAEKRRGLGTAATVESLAALQAAGYRNVHAWITEGNVASERIFVDLEFAMVS